LGRSEDATNRRASYRFGWVLALLFVTFVFLASGPSGAWVRVVTVALEGTTLLAVLLAAEVGQRVVRLVFVLVIVGLTSATVSLFADSTVGGNGVFYSLAALFISVSPVVIARAMWRRQVVDFRTVLGAICIYVLIGMLAAYVFSAIGSLGSGAFFAQTKHGSIADYLYFSFATITTTGYGDLTAAGGFGRACAVLEALLGQLYLVTVVALLVSNLSRSRRAAER
jgi:hypothetical protein